jgi:predicted porin
VRSDASGGAAGFSSNDANQIAVGYIYNLSKRTALYTTASRITNKGTQAFAIPGGPALTAGGKSQAVEAGLRHSF